MNKSIDANERTSLVPVPSHFEDSKITAENNETQEIEMSSSMSA